MKSVGVALLALLLGGCAQKESAVQAADSSGTTSSGAAVVLPPITMPVPASVLAQQNAKPACPHDGKWALCGILNRLKQSGFVVKAVDSASTRRKGFSVAPAVYQLGQARLEIFLYPDSASLARDIMAMDTVLAGPRGAPSQWGDVAPQLVRSANLAAVFLSTSPRMGERLALAITAGPPMAGSPR